MLYNDKYSKEYFDSRLRAIYGYDTGQIKDVHEVQVNPRDSGFYSRIFAVTTEKIQKILFYIWKDNK